MNIRMNRSFKVRWSNERLDEVLAGVVLRPRLRELVNAPFVRSAGALLLAPLAVKATGPEAFQDCTGFEAFINKIHVDDLVDDNATDPPTGLSELVRQSVKAALSLADRLETYGKYRVLLSLDADLPSISLRFFERREGEPWGAEDPEAFPMEEVLMIDTGLPRE